MVSPLYLELLDCYGSKISDSSAISLSGTDVAVLLSLWLCPISIVVFPRWILALFPSEISDGSIPSAPNAKSSPTAVSVEDEITPTGGAKNEAINKMIDVINVIQKATLIFILPFVCFYLLL